MKIHLKLTLLKIIKTKKRNIIENNKDSVHRETKIKERTDWLEKLENEW